MSQDNFKVQDTEALLRERLGTLQPERLELIDESDQHAGHAGAKGGGKHYRLLIVAEAFSGRTTMQRHRLVYDALDDLMQGKIHALSIRAMAPEEV